MKQFWRRYSRNRLAVVSLLFLVIISLGAILAAPLSPFRPDEISLSSRFMGFSSTHLLGTDHLGRDTFTRILYGSRVSLSVGFSVVVVAMLFGTIVGLVSGYFGRFVDAVLMRFTDGLLAIPLFFVLLVAMTVFRRSLPTLVLFVGLTLWMVPARVVRSEVLKTKNDEFVLAAIALGANHRRVIIRHLLPQAVPSMIVAATLGIAQAILIESALSYLGLGIQPPTPSWGNMLFDAQAFIYTAPHLAIVPGIMIFVTVLAYNVVGDGLRDALDPYATRR